MSRKIARTLFSNTKRKLLIVLPLLAVMSVSCGDDNKKENEPDDSQSGQTTAIIGKWQKYQRVLEDGTLTTGDLDEFWIFEKNNNFMVEDGGEITDAGTYKIDGMTLTISMYDVEDPSERQELRGFYEIKDGYMNYQFTYVGEDYRAEYRLRKVQ